MYLVQVYCIDTRTKHYLGKYGRHVDSFSEGFSTRSSAEKLKAKLILNNIANGNTGHCVYYVVNN